MLSPKLLIIDDDETIIFSFKTFLNENNYDIEFSKNGKEGLEKLTRYTAPFDFSGSPTISVPCGLGVENAPFGFQLIGRDLDEGLLLRGAHTYQQHTDWHKIHPNF